MGVGVGVISLSQPPKRGVEGGTGVEGDMHEGGTWMEERDVRMEGRCVGRCICVSLGEWRSANSEEEEKEEELNPK